jgi:hypothetical protein
MSKYEAKDMRFMKQAFSYHRKLSIEPKLVLEFSHFIAGHWKVRDQNVIQKSFLSTRAV